MLKKIITGVLTAAMLISSIACVSYAADNTEGEMYQITINDGITKTDTTGNSGQHYLTFKVNGMAGQHFDSGQVLLKVISGPKLKEDESARDFGKTSKDGMTYTEWEYNEELDEDVQVTKHMAWTNNVYTKAEVQYVSLNFAYSDICPSSDVLIEFYVKLADTNSDVIFEVVSDETFIRTYTDEVAGRTKYFTTGNPRYKLTAGTSKVVALTDEGGDEPGTTVTPSIGGTTQSDAEAFTEYADATAAGKHQGESESDQATAFAATITNGETASTGNIVWKVTDGSTTKYHKQSLGGNIAGSGTANVGLIVRGLYSDTATAGIAFLQ